MSFLQEKFQKDIQLAPLRKILALEVPDDPDILFELVQLFLTSSRRYLLQLRTACRSQDRETIVSVLHIWKSSSASLGAERLRTLCKELEARVQAGNLTLLEESVERLEQQFIQVQQELEALVKRTSPTKG